MTLDDLIPPHVTRAVADLGLHKIAGAMLGVPELTLKEALASLGAKAYLRRKEARSIADGIAAFAAVSGEKTAENPELMALLRRAAMPAALGAGITGAANMLTHDPMQQDGLLRPMAAGGLLGGGLGLLSPALESMR